MAGTRRVTGKNGSLVFGGVTLLDLEDVTVSITVEFAESKAWADSWVSREQLGGDWTATAKHWRRRAGAVSLMSWSKATVDLVAGAAPAALVVRDDTGGIIFQGDCFAGDGELSLPHGLLGENITLKGDGAPTTVA